MTLIERDIKPRDIVTADAIDDAFALDMAMGGSSNTVLHTLALANEAGVDYPLERINSVADKVPHICKVSPCGQVAHGRCASRGRHPCDIERSPAGDGHAAF